MPAFVVGDFEHEVQQALLRVVQIHQTRQQQRAHFRNGYPHRNAGFAVNIPKAHGETLQPLLAQAKLGNAFAHLAAGSTRLRDARQIAFDVNQKYGNALAAEGFRHTAQGHGFTRTGRTGDQAVAVRHFALDFERFPVGTRNLKCSHYYSLESVM
ncbi:Uncharacterised protein [Mycobacteroides abscessus subsp. massiliense]|nr:Uncharacterised protein [Mycobacteroides abscessus subsp. massiliense]